MTVRQSLLQEPCLANTYKVCIVISKRGPYCFYSLDFFLQLISIKYFIAFKKGRILIFEFVKKIISCTYSFAWMIFV